MKNKLFWGWLFALLITAIPMWAEISVSTTEPASGKPEHLYTMMNGNNYYCNLYTAPTQTDKNKAQFAFYASDTEGQYFIYNFTKGQWLDYTQADSFDNKQGFLAFSDSKPTKAKFAVDNYSGDWYQLSPITTSGTTDKYLNWYQGVNGKVDGQQTLGLWQDNGTQDAGSRWTFEEIIEIEGYTPTSPAILNEKLNTFGKTAYTIAKVYPLQQDHVGTAQLDEEDGVYTLYNDVLAASFFTDNGHLFFGGSNAMNLVGPTELFTIGFGSGTKVSASAMTLVSVETENLSPVTNAVGGAEHFDGKALKATFTYVYKGATLTAEWKTVLRDGSHYLRTEMILTGDKDIDMYDVVPMIYNVDTDAAGSTPAVVGNTRGAVLMSDKIFAGLEQPTAYNTVGDATGEDNYEETLSEETSLTSANWTVMATDDVPDRLVEVTGAAKNGGYAEYKKTNVSLTKNQKVCVTIKYTSGNHRLNFAGVDLLESSGSIAANDYHSGFSGYETNNNVFSFIVPNDGTYTIRAMVTTTEDIDASATYTLAVASPKEGAVINTDIVGIQGRWSRNTTLTQGENWKISAVVGLVAQDGKQSETAINKTQKRRSFLAYSERERAVPWRTNPVYISWYELNINRNNATTGNEASNMQASQVLDIEQQWLDNMFNKYGVGPNTFVIDDGWDNYGTWTFHSGFPNEMRDMSALANKQGAGVGAWLGPVGGYGNSGNYRRNYWSSKGGMVLSNPAYYQVFKDAATNLVQNQGTKSDGTESFQFFKFDGISDDFSALGPDKDLAVDVANENAEGIIRLERYVREDLKRDIFFNTTVGTWASPFWFHYTDAVWRQENDYDKIGNNSNLREKWITYRDRLVYQNYVQNSPICPINTLMTHGFILTKYGGPAEMPTDYASVLRELRCAFACGSGMVELYNDYSLMNSINDGALWKDLADCIRWQKRNADVLPDAHWVGGNPWDGSKQNIYGWAAWKADNNKSCLTLRNGDTAEQSITLTLRQALEIPAGVSGSLVLSKAFADQVGLTGLTEGEAIDIDTSLTLTLPANSVYIFDGVDANDYTVSDDPITDINDLSNAKTYNITSARGYLMNSANYATKLAGSAGSGVEDEGEASKSALAQQFAFLKINGNIYLYSVGAGKFVDADGNFEDSPFAAVTFVATNNATYPWQIKLGSNVINQQGAGGRAEGCVVNSYSTLDDGNQFTLTEAYKPSYIDLNEVILAGLRAEYVALVEEINQAAGYEYFYRDATEAVKAIPETMPTTEADFTTTIAALKQQVEALNAGEVLGTDLDGKTFFVTNLLHTGKYMRAANLAEKNGGTADGTYRLGANTEKTSNNLFKFIKVGDGNTYYIYNVGTEKYVGAIPETNDSRVPLVDSEAEAFAYTVAPGTKNGYCKIYNPDGTANRNALHMVNWDGVVRWTETADAGQFLLEECSENLVSLDDAHWYTIKNDASGGGYLSLKSGYVDDSGNLLLSNTTSDVTTESLWTYVGNETDGYRFFNKSQGSVKVLALTGSGANGRALMVDVSDIPEGYVTVFDMAVNGAGFSIKDHGSDHNYWNKRGDYLAYWDDSKGSTDNGSRFLFTDVTPLWPKMSTVENPKWYKINFVNGNTYLQSVDEDEFLQNAGSVNSMGQYFCFIGTKENMKIYSRDGYYVGIKNGTATNGQTSNLIYSTTLENATDFCIQESPSMAGKFVISKTSDLTTGFNVWGGASAGNNIGFWSTSDVNDQVVFIAEEDLPVVEYFRINGGERPTDISKHALWYNVPAASTGVADTWMEYALPIGNGQIGATFRGNIWKDELQLNEKTLWSGSPTHYGYNNHGYYQNMGSLFVEDKSNEFSLRDDAVPVNNYQRWLDIEKGIGGVRYEGATTQYERLYTASLPDHCIAANYKATGENKLNLHFYFVPDTRINASAVTYADGGAEYTSNPQTVSGATRFQVVSDGTVKTTSEGVFVSGDATYATVYIAAGTNFDADAEGRVTGTVEDVKTTVKARIDAVKSKSFAEVLSAATAKHEELMGETALNLVDRPSPKTTEDLLKFYNASAENKNSDEGKYLEELYWLYGRYFVVAANADTRVKAPCNLQGMWNDRSNSNFWHCDIHADVNVQMNYWPVEAGNLSAMHLPFLEWIIAMAQPGGNFYAVADKISQGIGGASDVRGWTTTTETDLMGGLSSWEGNRLKTLGAWYITHLWQHYKYSLDKAFLKRAFPVMLSGCQFMIDIATTGSDGTFEIPNEYSPEHGSSENGTAFAQQLAREACNETLKAYAVLGAESGASEDVITELQNFYDKLDTGLKTETFTYNGSDVTLLREWKYTNQNTVSDWNSHRHLSHLMCLYPLGQVSAFTDDAEAKTLYDAAVKSLELRGDAATGWSMGWKTNLWARALDGDHARQILSNALKHSTSYTIQMGGYGGCYYNLFDAHAPFQIDGNYGVSAGVNEMLLQSYDDCITLAPAIPSAWQKGSVKGLKAQGNFTVDEEWDYNGDVKVLCATITSNAGAPLSLRTVLEDCSITITDKNGQPVNIENEIATNVGDTFTIRIASHTIGRLAKRIADALSDDNITEEELDAINTYANKIIVK